jgi:outer membrane receptor protein involved in Fe transport
MLILISLSSVLCEMRRLRATAEGKSPSFATAILLVAALPNVQAADGAPAAGATTNAPSTASAPVQSQGGTNSTVLPTVTVTGDLDRVREEIAPSLGAVTYTIGPNQIQSMGQGENASFQQVILQAPGVVQEEFGEVHVRGDHGDLQYRVNGVLLPESLNGFGQEIDTHLIQSVTLMTGTMPAQFGDRTAGIFDVTTKTGSQLNGAEFSLYGGSYDTFNPSFQWGGTTSNLDYFVAVSYLHNDHGIDNTTASPNPLHDATDQEKLFGYFSHHFDQTSRLTLLLSSSDAGFQIPDTAGVAPIYQLADGAAANSAAANNYQTEQNYYAVLAYQKSAGNLSYQVSALSRYTDIDFTPDPVQGLLLAGNAAHVDNSDWANGLQVDSSYELGDHHTLRAGMLGTYDIERLDSTSAVFPSSSQFTASPNGETIPALGGPAPAPGNPPQSSLTPYTIIANGGNTGLTAGLYLQDEWHLTDHLTLNYGARYDIFDVSFDNEWQISPRANLVWQINDATTAHVGYARYFMPPSLQYVHPSTVKKFEYTTDAPFNAQDDPQKAERDNYFDMGLSRQITPAWQITGDSFCKLAKHLLDDGQFGSAVILDNFNYASGTVYGAELSSTYKQGPITAYGNYSYVQTWVRDIDSVENEFPNDLLTYLTTNHMQLDHQGRFTGSGGISYELLKNLRVYSDFLYGSGLRAGFANKVELSPYCPVNVGLEYTWKVRAAGIRQLKLRFDCLNILDEPYELRNGTGVGIAAPAYGARRAFYGGLTMAF